MRAWPLLLLFASSAAFGGEYEENLVRHADCGHALDQGYYDAGNRVDRACLTSADPVLRRDAEALDAALRREYLALEAERRNLEQKLYLPKPPEQYLLSIENRNDASAVDSGWVGFNLLKFEWSDKTGLELPLRSFLHCRHLPNYDYNCAPSEAIFVNGRRSGEAVAVTGVLPESIPPGPAKLIISGLDCDKPGAPTPITIRIHGHEVFSGPNPFRKNGWTRLELTVPPEFLRPPPAAEGVSLRRELDALKGRIRDFSTDAGLRADRLAARAAASPQLPRIVKKRDPEAFVLAMDVENSCYGETRFAHPGNYLDMGHAALMCGELDVNLASLFLLRSGAPEKLPALARPFAENAAFPFLVWGTHDYFRGRDVISFDYYFDRPALERDLERMLNGFRNLPNFAGIQVDEPNVSGKSADFKKLRKTPEYQRALAASGLDEERFKIGLMAGQCRYLYDSLAGRGLFASTVIMNTNPQEPQASSYTAMGKSLPYLGTDLYNNGGIEEAFSMQLLKHAASGKAVMWPGAGYSCRNPDALRRSLATGIAFADGIHMWTYTFCSKYRDANYFWRYGGKRPDVDDRGARSLDNWHPDYWAVTREMYGIAARNDRFLRNRESLAQTAVVLSEAAMIEAAATDRERCQAIWQEGLDAYRKLCRKGIPVDVLFAENLTPERLRRYREIVPVAGAVPPRHEPLSKPPLQLDGLPEEVTVAVQKSPAGYLVHLIDYIDGRTVSGHRLIVNLPGNPVVCDAAGNQWKELPPFRGYQLLIVK